MKSSTLEFPRNARAVFTAVRRVVEACDRFSHVRCDENTFVLTASRGMRLIPLGENVRIRVVATRAESTKVIIEKTLSGWRIEGYANAL